jgi:hypothetical protein
MERARKPIDVSLLSPHARFEAVVHPYLGALDMLST